ncbi:MAG: hypothetical protein RM811_023995, partial [Endozoicomonas sp.]
MSCLFGRIYGCPVYSHKRDQEHFERCQTALKDAKEAEDKGLINLFYFDESGFSQEPCVPYA